MVGSATVNVIVPATLETVSVWVWPTGTIPASGSTTIGGGVGTGVGDGVGDGVGEGEPEGTALGA